MYKLLLSLRYFRTRFLALASLLAITFGVAMLVIVLSIMGGYLAQLRETIRGQESHLQVMGIGQYGVTDVAEVEEVIRSVENVKATAPFIERSAVYQSILSFHPCILKGIIPRKQVQVGELAHFTLRPDELQGILRQHAPGPGEDRAEPFKLDRTKATRAVNAVIKNPDREDLGLEEFEYLFSRKWRSELLESQDPELLEKLDGDIPPASLVGIQLLLDQQMYLGQIITVITLSPYSESRGALKQNLIVAGALRTGDFDQDSSSIYAQLGVVKNLLQRGRPPGESESRYQGIRVALHDATDSRLGEAREKLTDALGSAFPDKTFFVRTWKDLRKTLQEAVLIEKFLVYFIVLILVVFTGSMILLMLLLAVIEKTRDVGVLMSLGATPQGVTSIFLINGIIISFLGTVLGFILGLAFCLYINDIHDAIYDITGWSIFKAEIYHMDRIPITFDPWDIILSTVPPVIIGLLASMVPALWAPRRDPIKSIQYE